MIVEHRSELFRKIMYNSGMYRPARKVKKNYLSCTGYFASCKNMRQIAFESSLEKNFFTMLEFNDNVKSFREQPYTFYDLGDKYNKYTPDASVILHDGSEILYEVKYSSDLKKDPGLEEKIEYLKKRLETVYSKTLTLFTDEDIDPVFIDNANFLYKYAFLPSNEKYERKVSDILDHLETDRPVSEIISQLHHDKMVQIHYIPYMWNYLFFNTHKIDMQKRFTNHTVIKAADK